MRVDAVEILLPVSMVGLAVCRRAFNLGSDRRNPDSIEAHALNVVEVILNAFEASTAIFSFSGVACRIRATVGACEAIGKYLVDAAAAPLVGRGSRCLQRVQCQAQGSYTRENTRRVHGDR